MKKDKKKKKPVVKTLTVKDIEDFMAKCREIAKRNEKTI